MEHLRVVHPYVAPWRQYLMVALCIVAGGWIFYAWNRQWTRVMPGTDGWAPNAAIAARFESPMQAAVAGRPISDVLVILYSGDKPSMAGKPVRLNRVCVRNMTDHGAFWVSQLGTQPVFVAPTPGAGSVKLGQSVNVEGMLARMPSADQLRARYPHLSDEQVAELEADGLLVEASEIEVRGWY